MKYSSEPSSEAIRREIVGDEKFKEIVNAFRAFDFDSSQI